MSRLLIVTALMSEAVALIDFYRMQKQPKQAFFHLYQTALPENIAQIDLLICGVGAKNMYRGLKSYLDVVNQSEPTLYLNLGIAGALNEPHGTLLWANSIAATDIALPEGAHNLAYSVHSLDKQGKNYQAGVLFDMEAEAWLRCIAENTQQFTPGALFCAKVVSDSQVENTHKIDKHWVRNIVHQNIFELDVFINNILKLLR